MKFFVIYIIGCLFYTEVNAQQGNSKLKFNQITYHLDSCSNSFQTASIRIYNDTMVEVSRKLVLENKQVDKQNSGNFKGSIGAKFYRKIITLINKINWNDLGISTAKAQGKSCKSLIITFDGSTKRFKLSATANNQLAELEKLLLQVALNNKLERFDGFFDFQYVD